MLAEFHFLRPQLLWLLIIIVPITLLLWRLKSSSQSWQKLVDREMLAHLLVNDQGKVTRWPLLLMVTIWIITCISLAGPSWKKLPQPQFVNQQPLVLLVDLSPSMSAADIKPSRLVKMRFKLIDLLKARAQGLTAMVVYAGDAHVLAPLSDDTETLISLVPTLSPDIMPVSGSRTEEGLELALALIAEQGYRSGDILLVTDGVTEQAQQNMRQILNDTSIRLSVLGVGTEQGAPIPIAKQGFAKDALGNIVMAKLVKPELQQLASVSGGIYRDMQLTNSDVEQFLAFSADQDNNQLLQRRDNNMDQWDDFGQWLLLLIIPLFLCSFRRGWLLQFTAVCFIVLPMLQPAPAMALGWSDLWQTGNQQGAKALAEEDYQRAADSFSDQSWQGIAQYKNQNFQQAGDNFARQNSADGFYNQGNALAQQGKFKQALQAYDKALAINPEMADALANRSLLEQLIKQNEQQNQDQQSKDQQNQDQQSQDQQNQDQQNQDQQNQDQQNQDQQSKDQQSQDQQSKDQQSQDQQGKDQQGKDQQGKDQQSKGQQSKDQQGKDQQSQDQQVQGSDQQSKEQLNELRQQQQQRETQALQQAGNDQSKQKDGERAQMDLQLTDEQKLKQQQLQNWLGQLPEDASRLVRNKFNYEYQKKRQAYINGQWQPTQEQRW